MKNMGSSIRITTEKFVTDAIYVHGDKYDYSKSVCNGSKDKVIVICKEHGEFVTDYDHHVRRSQGCGKCSQKKKKTLDDFILEAIKIHGFKYDYSKTNYANGKTKVCIICPKHGEFWQSPHDHLQGQGCPECGKERRGMLRRSNTEDFIRKAREINGEKYDYSNVKYVKSNEDVIVICREHGEFLVTPNNHLKGKGCPKCVGRNKTTDEFVEECKKSHQNNDYDYSETEYNGNKKNVAVICHNIDRYGNEHGLFYQNAGVHLNGGLCPKCRYELFSKSKSMGLNEFKRRANEVHGGKYDYSLIEEYWNNMENAKIICPYHGVFEQSFANHLNGQGCPKCAHRSYAYTTEEWVKEASKVHGSYYDYSKVNYVNAYVPVEIICNKHGSFFQKPHDHLSGCGCPKCHVYRMEREWSMYLDKRGINYLIQYRDLEKFGRLSLDFYLPEYNSAIECQGIEHFKPTSFSKKGVDAEEKYRQLIERDVLKNKICKEFGIRLFYFTNLKYVIKEINLKSEYDGIYNNCIYTKKKELLEEMLKDYEKAEIQTV